MDSWDTFNGYSAENFERWLGNELRKVYVGTAEEKYLACDFRHLGVSRGESHIDALQGLFKKLNDEAKEQFRDALGNILRHVKQGDFPSKAMADIVALIGLTDAYSTFSDFATVFSGAWGETQPSLIYDALSVLMMFDRTNEAYESAKNLATSMYFPSALVFDAYLVMFRSRPENWREDLALLRDQFIKIIAKVENSADSEMLKKLHWLQCSLAQSLVEAVPLSVLGQQLATLNFNDWLIDALLKPSVGSLYLTWNDEIDEIVVIDCATQSRMAKVETTSSFEVVSIYRGLLRDQMFNDNTLLTKESSDRLENILGANMCNRLSPSSSKENIYGY